MIPPSGPSPEELAARRTPHPFDPEDVVSFRYISPSYKHVKVSALKSWAEQAAAKAERAEALKEREEAIKNLPTESRKAVGSPTFSEFLKIKEEIDPAQRPKLDPKAFDWKAKSDLKKSKPKGQKVRS